MGYTSCKADPDLWLKAVTRPEDNVHYYAYILCYVDDTESETGRISQVPTTTIGHTTKPTDAGHCKMGLPRSTLMGKNAMEIIALIYNCTCPFQQYPIRENRTTQ